MNSIDILQEWRTGSDVDVSDYTRDKLEFLRFIRGAKNSWYAQTSNGYIITLKEAKRVFMFATNYLLSPEPGPIIRLYGAGSKHQVQMSWNRIMVIGCTRITYQEALTAIRAANLHKEFGIMNE